jgi:dihydroorotase (multifunctional complex type)
VLVETVVRNALIVSPRGRYESDIGITDGRVVAITSVGGLDGRQEIDVEGRPVLPGLIDAHIHLREPGFADLENFHAGTRGAAKGGFTTVFEMPTSLPGVASVDVLLARATHLGSRAVVDFGLYAGAGDASMKAIRELADAGAIAFKTRLRRPTPGREAAWEGQYVSSDGNYFEVLERIAETGRLACLHPENWSIAESLTARAESSDGILDPEAAAAINFAVVEGDHVQRAIFLSDHAGARLSLCHIAHPDSLGLVRHARAKGQAVNVECAFADLFMERADSSLSAMYIPSHVPGQENQLALWESVRDGTVNQVSSDHAPHSKAMIDEVWRKPGEKTFGLACNELIVPLFLQRVREGKVTLEDLSRLMSENPARSYGVFPAKGAIEVGSDADLTVLDMNAVRRIRSRELESVTKFTPFDGREVRGIPWMVLVRGIRVLDEGVVVGAEGYGRWVRGTPCKSLGER